MLVTNIFSFSHNVLFQGFIIRGYQMSGLIVLPHHDPVSAGDTVYGKNETNVMCRIEN